MVDLRVFLLGALAMEHARLAWNIVRYQQCISRVRCAYWC